MVILYLVVRNLEVKQKIDKIRQEWTCDVLLFYNYFLFIATCLILALRVTKNQTLVLIESFLIGIMVLIFTYYSIAFFIRGLYMYEDLPEGEVRKMPESYFLYSVYLICFFMNAIFIVGVLYILCYIALMTYQLRGVLFQTDELET